MTSETGRRQGFFAAVLGALLGGASQGAAAQEQPAARPSQVEEVIVTARRVEESLQDVPISISAMTGQEIAQMGILDTNDVAQYMPNVVMENSERNNNTQIFIRGTGGGSSNAASIQSGVGIYTDGMYMPRTQGGFMSTLDIERIEVLRGPQGTLFGKNSTGGAVNIVTVKPQPETSGSFTLRAGDYNRREARGMVNVPITDTLFARFTGLVERRDGFYEDTVTGMDYGNRKRFAGRAALRFVPNDELTFDVAVTYENQPERPSGATCIWEYEGRRQTRHEAVTGENLQQVCTGSLATAGERKFATDTEMFFDTQMFSLVTQTSWTPPTNGVFFDNREFKIIAGAASQEQSFVIDQDYTPLRVALAKRTGTDSVQRQVELQFNASNDRLSLVSGFYWAYDRQTDGGNDCTDELFSIDLAAGESIDCVQPGMFMGLQDPRVGGARGTQIFADLETYGLYANLNYNLTDALYVTVGARQTREEREFSRLGFREVFVNTDGFVAPINANNLTLNTRGGGTWDELTPTVSLGYSLPSAGAFDSGNLYLTYANGFLSGGFNTEFNPHEVGDAFLYDPETVDSYELGVKSTWFDGRMRLNLALFDADYEDRQISLVVPNTGQFDSQEAVLTLTSNAAAVDADGVELELTLAPIDGMLIGLTYGTVDTVYTQFLSFDPVSGTYVNTTDLRPDHNNPDTSGGARIEYAFNLANGATLTPRLIASYRGELERTPSRSVNDPLTTAFQKSYTTWDARLSWTNAEGSRTVTGFVVNLTDEEYPCCGSVSFVDDYAGSRGWSQILLGPPRMWGVELQMNF